MASKRTDSQNRAIYALLNELGAMDSKEDMVFDFSKGRTSSSAELTISEAAAMITELNNIKYGKKKPTQNTDGRDKKTADRYGLTLKAYQDGKQMRIKIIWYAYRMPEHLKLTYIDEKTGKKKIDYRALDRMLQSRMQCKKVLNAQDPSELQITVTQMKHIRNSYRN